MEEIHGYVIIFMSIPYKEHVSSKLYEFYQWLANRINRLVIVTSRSKKKACDLIPRETGQAMCILAYLQGWVLIRTE